MFLSKAKKRNREHKYVEKRVKYCVEISKKKERKRNWWENWACMKSKEDSSTELFFRSNVLAQYEDLFNHNSCRPVEDCIYAFSRYLESIFIFFFVFFLLKLIFLNGFLIFDLIFFLCLLISRFWTISCLRVNSTGTIIILFMTKLYWRNKRMLNLFRGRISSLKRRKNNFEEYFENKNLFLK